jgi:hypothetical protein
MEKRYLTVEDAEAQYGPKRSSWRKWIRTGQLGTAVVRFGKLVFVDSVVLNERIAKTSQLLLNGNDLDVQAQAKVRAGNARRPR